MPIPGGIYVHFVGLLWGVLSDGYQAVTFYPDGDTFFFILFLGYVVVTMHYQARKLLEKNATPCQEVRESISTGVPSKTWSWIMFLEQTIEGPATGLIGAYGNCLITLTHTRR